MAGGTDGAERRALSTSEELSGLRESSELTWLDAHTHLRETEGLAEYLEETGLHLIFSSSTPEEYRSFTHPNVAWTFGIHPWRASMKAVEEAHELLETVPILGEIGMDSVWTETDLKVQEEVFRYQLELAEKHDKLVVLHTKGQEERISEIMEHYDLPYLIHWYAGPADLSLVERARFITLGPEPHADLVHAVKPEQRLLETDGLMSLEWLDGRERTLRDWLPALERSLELFAQGLGIDKERLQAQISRNNAALWQAARTKPISS